MKLKEIREKAGVSQRQAAIDLNLSPVVYGRYENGTREPSNLTLIAMANYFGVTVDEILGRATNENPDTDDPWELRDRLRRDPNMRMLFSAASRATPDHIRAAAEMLKALEPPTFPDEPPQEFPE